MSPYLKDKLVYIGQSCCYENGDKLANKLLNIKTNDTAIYRLTDDQGEQAEKWLEELGDHAPFEVKSDEVIYAQSDGSMLFTREESWKEVKLGRIFKSGAIHKQSPNRPWIRQSEYVTHLGSHKNFEEKMSDVLDHYESLEDRLVFINDGAKWIQNWIEAEYPRATQILDFYHAMEHICAYAKLSISEDEVRKKWMKKTGKMKEEKGYQYTKRRIDKLACKTKKMKEKKRKLMGYLENNKHRMNYLQYIKRGLLIGSGAIEAANRNVLQKRLKLSGQRWSIRGLKNIIRLRVLQHSGHWDKVVQHFRNAA